MKMKKKNLLLVWLLMLTLAMASLSGCGQKAEVKEKQTEIEQEVEEAKEQEIVDMAGRNVTLPGKIAKVYAATPIGTNFMYTFDDELLIGINYDLTDNEKKFVSERWKTLPNLGGWYGKGNEGNIEEIIKAAPEIVIYAGVDETAVSFADELQEKLNIPVVLIDTKDFDRMAESYRFLGKVFGNEKRGEELASYTEKTYKEVKEIGEKIPEEKRVNVYYAEGENGLQTDPSGSIHSRLIDICGGKNVADVELKKGYGKTDVSMEQILAWNPEYIIIENNQGKGGGNLLEAMNSDPTWGEVAAVQKGNVFTVPLAPSGWFDRPPACNTIIGLKWVSSILYPEQSKIDIRKEAKEFYKLFYHYELSDEDLDTLLDHAVAK